MKKWFLEIIENHAIRLKKERLIFEFDALFYIIRIIALKIYKDINA